MRFKKVNLLIFFFVFFLLVLSLSQAAISNPRPTIHMEFYQSDAPIKIDYAKLLFLDTNFETNIQAQTTNNFTFIFNITDYLFPGNYALEVKARDKDNNTKILYEDFAIEESENKIWVQTPNIPFFEDFKQDIAMGDNIPFTIYLESLVPATCRLKKFTPHLMQSSEEEIYNNPGFIYLNQNNGIQTTSHTIQALSSGNAQTNIILNNPFDYSNTDSGAYVVICKQTSQDNQISYFLKKIYVGYDLTNPDFDIIFDPETIFDESHEETNMHINSQEDLLVCTYNHTQNPQPQQSDVQGELPSFSTIQSISSYLKNQTKLFYFGGDDYFELQTPYEFKLDIVCYNPAMRQSMQKGVYFVELTRDFIIELEKDWYTQKDPLLNITTSLEATCDYAFLGETTTINSNPSTEHEVQLNNLEDDFYSIDVNCITETTTKNVQFFFTVDTQAPSIPNITGRTSSCGEDDIEITITPNNPGLQRYNISLLLGSQILVNTIKPQAYTTDPVTYSLPVAPLIENETYTWKVYAQDEGGLTSSLATHDVTITQFESTVCDEIPPTGWVETDVTSAGFEVEIHCQDGESGCADYFTYKTIPVDEACTFDISGQTQYSSLPLFFSEDEKICYQVFDNAGNFVNEQSLISASFDISLISPKFGIADTKAFTFQVETKRNSVCKHGYNAVAHPNQISDWYLTLDDFDTSGGTIHTFAFDSANYLQLDETQAKDTSKWVVICNELGAYRLLEIDPFGFDTTVPSIIVKATPNPVIDPGNMITNLSVMTDDNTVCTYLNSDGVATGFPNYDPENPNSYKKIHSVEVSYWGVKEAFDDNQLVKCRNLAQNYNEEQYIIHVAPEDKVQITINNDDYSAVKNIDLNVSTGQLATCSYRTDPDEDFVQMQQTGSYEHLNAVVLLEGETTFEVFCIASGSGDEGLKAKSITLDTVSPTVEILTTDESCSLDGIIFSLNVVENGSGIDYVEYEILGPDLEVIASDTTNDLEIEENLDLEDGKTYKINVIAYDKVGNEGSASKSVKASEYDAVACDTVAPNAGIQTSPTWGGYNATVTCTDNVGCTDQFSYLITTGNCTGSQTSKSYAAQPTLVDKTTNFCYKVFDGAGNFDEGQYSFTVIEQCYNGIEDPDEEGVDCGGVCAEVNPCDGGLRKLELVSPQFGISSSKIFNLEVRTNADATCKQGYNADAHPDDVSDWYDSLNDFTSTGLLVHSTLIESNSILQLDANLDKDTTEWVVICKQFEVYKVLEINPFGFDTTVPVITVKAEPNPVIDPGNMATKLTVTTDDNTVCTYLDKDGVPTGFSDYDPENFDAYKKTHSTTISYWAVKEFFDDVQEIKCRNLAQLFSDTTYKIAVEPEDKVQITINNKEYTNKANIVLNVSTGQKAYCKYRMDDSSATFIDMQTSGDYNHKQAVSLTEGPHDFEIFCTARGSGDEGIKAKTITLDTTAPIITILSTEKSCSLDSYTFTLLASDGDGSGIDYYDYEISGPNGTLITDTTSDSEVYEELELLDGESYTIDVTGYDKAGNSGKTSKTIIASTFNPLICDTTPPTAKIKTTAIWQGHQATISCEDDIGCSDKFTYVFVDKECNLTQNAKDYDDQPFIIIEDTKLCFTVFDLAGNKDESSKLFSIKEQCFNEIEDPDEEGVDCGGPCLAECGTCNNGKQDRFELGIDCGGICETIRSCETGLKTNDPNDPNNPENKIDDNKDKECSTSADCQAGYICNYNYECEPDLNRPTPPIYDEGMNIWGLILIILGILLIGGGSYYIYYSRTKKAEEERINLQRMQQRNSLQAQQMAVQRAAEAKRLESLKEKHLQQKENLNKHVEERKEKRKSLLDVFDVDTDETKQKETDSVSQSEAKDIAAAKVKAKEDPKLDEGYTEEYIDVRKLHKNPLNDLEKLKIKQDEEKKQTEITEAKSSENKDLTKNIVEEKTIPNIKTNIFSELKSLAEKESIGKQSVETNKPVFKTEINSPEIEKVNEEVEHKEIKSSDSFAALKNMVSHSSSSSNLNKESLPSKKVSSDELMNIFTKDVSSFDENTLLSVLTILMEEKKLDMSTSRNVLEKLADKGLISRQKINVLFSKLVKGK